MPIGRAVLWIAVIAPLGCGPATGPTNQASAAWPAAQPKQLILAAPRPVPGFGIWNINEAYGAPSVWNIHSNGLTSIDDAGAIVPRLAASLPSLDDGSIAVSGDGTMTTTWRLRPNLTWQDGAPFTADDLTFSWQVNKDPAIPGERSAQARSIENVAAADPLTAVITWKTTFYRALQLDLREFWPLPRHLLADAFEQDKQGFQNLPYWTTEYVHLGPFRLADFGLGETLTFERVDAYFLGRPKIDRVIIQVMGDANTVLANVRAGAVDATTEQSMPPDLVLMLRDEWQKTGAGASITRQGALYYFKVQFDPLWATPPELSRDPRVRQALYLGLDRESIRETLFPGVSGTAADTFVLDSDSRLPVVGKPFARYPYDPTAAARQLAEAGWRPPVSGRLLNQAGEPVQLNVRASPPNAKEVAIAASNWRQLGIDVVEEIEPPALAADQERRASFPAFTGAARGYGDLIFPNFDARSIPTSQNRYTGQNLGAYANANLQRLIETLYGTIDPQAQAVLLRDAGEILAIDLPAFPLYFRAEFMTAMKGVRGVTDGYASAQSGTIARNAHLWDRE
jgi:peptide/nickel transport system substrate-binding protein